MAEEADFLFIVYLVAGFALDGWSFPISLIKLTFVIEDHVRALKNFIKFFLVFQQMFQMLLMLGKLVGKKSLLEIR